MRCVLIGCHMVYGTKQHVLSDPLNWLRLIDRFRISGSWAPNFAFALVNDALKRTDERWDLSCLQVLLTAGEAVSSTTVRDFIARLEEHGMKASALRPAFGMAELGSGVVFANAARSHMPTSLAALGPRQCDPDFFVGNMIPTCISDDAAAARSVNRRTLASYVLLPNYRNYWRQAGYAEEMEAVEKALAAGQRERVPELLHDRWLADTTLVGSAAQVRDAVDAWREAGVRTPILVPSSAAGNQLRAFEELFEAYADR